MKDFFIEEVNKCITNHDLQQCTIIVANSIPQYFFEIPASSTKKYHPVWANQKGGLVAHSLITMQWAKELLRLEGFNPEKQDEVMFASAFHDAYKNGLQNTNYTVSRHPQLGAENIYSILSYHLPKSHTVDVDLIHRLIITHMGQWGEHKPQTSLEKLVAMADYCASRQINGFDLQLPKDN